MLIVVLRFKRDVEAPSTPAKQPRKGLMMTFYLALATMLAALLASPDRASAQTWNEYRPAGIGYRVEMPGQWKIASQDVPTDIGKIEMHMATVDEKTKVYMSIYSVFPKDHIAKTPSDRLLDNARDGAVKNVKGKLLSERKLDMGGSPARHIVVDAATARVSQRIVLSGDKLIQAIFVGPVGAEAEPSVARFFDSFAVTSP